MKIFVNILLVFCICVAMVACTKKDDNQNNNFGISADGTNKDSVIAADESNKDSVIAAEETNKVTNTFAWKTSTPEEQGLDITFLDNADKRIQDNYPNIYSLLVVKNGFLVYEKYYQGMNEKDANPVYSVTKSVMSALTGIAISDGLIEGKDQKVSDIVPKYFKDVDDKRKKDITVKNVLTMQGGLESVDDDFLSFYISRDYFEYTVSQPMNFDAGTKFTYNTGLTQFLSAIIEETSKMSTYEYAQKKLFNPLGIEGVNWHCDSEGHYSGGFGLSLTPRDMAKFGYLYLKNGEWDGDQIVPQQWIKDSTRKQVSVDSDSAYGYLFWIKELKAKEDGKVLDAYAAAGSGGQYIVVVPELDIVTVITANDNSRSNDNSDTVDIMWDYVIKAVK